MEFCYLCLCESSYGFWFNSCGLLATSYDSACLNFSDKDVLFFYFYCSTKASAKGKAAGKAGTRFWKNVGLGFKTPREAIEGTWHLLVFIYAHSVIVTHLGTTDFPGCVFTQSHGVFHDALPLRSCNA